MATSDGLSFSRAEAEALKLIIGDWLNDGIVTPPFEPEIEAVLKKLGFAIPISAGVSPVVTQESASERGAIRPRTRDQ